MLIRRPSHLVILMALLTSISVYVAATIGRSQGQESGPIAGQPPWAAIAKGRIDIEGGTIRLAAQREGLIREVFVEEGDGVKKGQELARLDTTSAQLAVNQAQAELAVARTQIPLMEARLAAATREAARLVPLAKTNVVSRQERDQANDQVLTLSAEFEGAKLSVVVAEKRLAIQEYEIEARIVRAPLDGRIVRRSAKLGDGTSTLNVTELFLLAPSAPRIVRAELDEQMVDAVEPGQEAEIALEFDPKRTFRGKVLRIGEVFGVARNRADDPNATQDTRVVELVTTIEEGEALRIGQRVLVQVKP